MRAEARPPGSETQLNDSNFGQARPAEIPTGLSEGMRKALLAFREAVQSKKVEPICTTYRALREVASGMKLKDLVQLADQATGLSTLNVVVSAFSHLHCFMCNDGALICDQCEGTGKLDREPQCPQCDGFGVVPCNFCRGGGLADRSVIPPELRKAVLERQLAHVRRDLKHLAETQADLAVVKINAQPQPQRRATIAWLLRLHARITDLARFTEIVDPEERARLSSAALKIAKHLEALTQG
jgi:hypothetical protein